MSDLIFTKGEDIKHIHKSSGKVIDRLIRDGWTQETVEKPVKTEKGDKGDKK